jgi:hypothetical protein
MIILYYNIIYIIMTTKKKKASKPRAPRRVAIKTSLAAADIWANNAALWAQQNRENDVLRAELRNQGLEQKLMLQAMKADVERDRLYYKRLADMGDQRATVALRDIEANSAVRVADVRANVTQSVSPEGHDSIEAYDLAFSPFYSPIPGQGKRGDVREYIRQITRNQADTERRLATPQNLRTPAPERITAAVSEQLGTPRRPTSVTATPSAVRVDFDFPNPFMTPTPPPRQKNDSQSQKGTPLQSRVLPPIQENPHAVTQNSGRAPSMNIFGGF